MSELRSVNKDSIKASYHGESVLITSIKYTRVVKTLVVASLPDSPVKSVQTSNAVSNDPVPFSGSDPTESEAPVSGLRSGLKPLNKSRPYSTMASVPYYKINKAPSVNQVCLYSRVPPLIRLSRLENGSFKFDGLDSVNLLHSRGLKEVLDSIKGKMRELESINDKGYINSTRLSDYPVLSGYLKPYVKSKKLDKLEIDELESMGEQGILNLLDKGLTLREKRVLVV